MKRIVLFLSLKVTIICMSIVIECPPPVGGMQRRASGVIRENAEIAREARAAHAAWIMNQQIQQDSRETLPSYAAMLVHEARVNHHNSPNNVVQFGGRLSSVAVADDDSNDFHLRRRTNGLRRHESVVVFVQQDQPAVSEQPASYDGRLDHNPDYFEVQAPSAAAADDGNDSISRKSSFGFVRAESAIFPDQHVAIMPGVHLAEGGPCNPGVLMDASSTTGGVVNGVLHRTTSMLRKRSDTEPIHQVVNVSTGDFDTKKNDKKYCPCSLKICGCAACLVTISALAGYALWDSFTLQNEVDQLVGTVNAEVNGAVSVVASVEVAALTALASVEAAEESAIVSVEVAASSAEAAALAALASVEVAALNVVVNLQAAAATAIVSAEVVASNALADAASVIAGAGSALASDLSNIVSVPSSTPAAGGSSSGSTLLSTL